MESEYEERVLDLRSTDDDGRAKLEAAIENNLPWIRAYVCRRMTAFLRRRGEVTDYVQDVVVQFLQYGTRRGFSDDAHFRAALPRVVENTLNDRYDWFTAQRRGVSFECPLPSDSALALDRPSQEVETPSETAEIRERVSWIRFGLRRLQPEDQEIIEFKTWENLSFVAISRRLQISPDAARMRYGRAVARLGETIVLRRRSRACRASAKCV